MISLSRISAGGRRKRYRLGAANTLDQSRILELEENQLQEFFRQVFLVRNVANPDSTLSVAAVSTIIACNAYKPFGKLSFASLPSIPMSLIGIIGNASAMPKH